MVLEATRALKPVFERAGVGVVNFDDVHTLPRDAFRRRVITLSPPRMNDACRALDAATGC